MWDKNFQFVLNSLTEMNDNSIQIRDRLEKFLYDLRIQAEVFVEEMVGAPI